MKIFSILLILAAVYSTQAIGQNCAIYFPSKLGAVTELTSYDKKDKVTGINRTTIKERTELTSGVSLNVESVSLDAKGQQLSSGTYTVKCENGVFYLDMKSMLAGMAGQNGSGDATVTANNLEIPANPKVGDVLNDGNVTMTMNTGGPFSMSTTINIKNRKVEGFEDITTTAGTFSCMKISYDVEMDMIVKSKTKAIQWLSKDAGTVKSQSLDLNGNVLSYTLLTSKK